MVNKSLRMATNIHATSTANTITSTRDGMLMTLFCTIMIRVPIDASIAPNMNRCQIRFMMVLRFCQQTLVGLLHQAYLASLHHQPQLLAE